jgi:multisubunit Na+/H+ antiporter MnhF subunit
MNLAETHLPLSQQIEDLMVERNPRGMKTVQAALQAGYYARAAQLMYECQGTVLIGTGFPVLDTFETDGPVGAIALYNVLQSLGATPVLVCGAPLANVLAEDYRVHEIKVGPHAEQEQEAQAGLAKYNPSLIISIERPGQAADGKYYNMRSEDISPRAACFDSFLRQAECASIAIGDGGNEIGMGNLAPALRELNIVAADTPCDELVIADVSNWAALGLIALLGVWHQRDLLADVESVQVLKYLSERGSVDGVTRENTLTEDNLPASVGVELIQRLRHLTGFAS